MEAAEMKATVKSLDRERDDLQQQVDEKTEEIMNLEAKRIQLVRLWGINILMYCVHFPLHLRTLFIPRCFSSPLLSPLPSLELSLSPRAWYFSLSPSIGTLPSPPLPLATLLI